MFKRNFSCERGFSNNSVKTIDIYNYPDKYVPYYIATPEDIVDTYNELINKERFVEFLNNVRQGKEDHIRVVRYTAEGDQLLRDLEYDGELIKSTIDTRRGIYVRGSISTTCNSIRTVEMNDSTDYILEGCGQPMNNVVLTIRQ